MERKRRDVGNAGLPDGQEKSLRKRHVKSGDREAKEIQSTEQRRLFKEPPSSMRRFTFQINGKLHVN